MLTSVIAVDQVGDLSSDTFDFDSLEMGLKHDDHFVEDYKMKLTDPSTCPLAKYVKFIKFRINIFIISVDFTCL